MEILQITIHARDNKLNELLRTCHLMSEGALQKIGCKRSHVSQAGTRGNIIILEQQWEKSSVMNDFFRSDLFGALMGAIKLLGRSYEFSINGSTHEEGIEMLNCARNE